MTDDAEPGERPAAAEGAGASGLRLVGGRREAGVGPPPPVALRREFKGLTVADLLRDEIVDKLPGQARSALHHLERGDHAAAERALPGSFAPVLSGPWRRRRERRLLVALVVIAAIAGASAVASSFS
ncbi:MAG: hypothetical protein JNN13_05310 [Planctomycetes bacterium]|nr:hypothetical protein [Planctomycetota bacterium]